MSAALPCEFIDRARLDSKERSNFLFGHNVLSDGIKVFVREQTGAISYWPHGYNWLLKFMLDRHGQKSFFGLAPNAARAWDAESLLDLCRLM
jgi:hypothetical protein